MADVYTVGIDGAGLRRLTTTPIPPRGIAHVGSSPLAWSPDSARLLAFRHDRLAIVEVASRESVDLKRIGVQYGFAGARWAAGPTRAVASAARAPIVYVQQDTIVAGGKKLTRGHFPRWSPDGTRIALTRLDDLYVMNADGSGVRKLVGGPGHELYPAWSPDGRTIAFASNRGGGEHEIYTVRVDGTGLHRLTRTARHVDDVQPAFSPDGRFVVFTSNRVAYWNYELYRMRADGTGLTRLTFWGSGR